MWGDLMELTEQQINDAVVEFKRTGNQEVFSDLFTRLKPMLERKANREVILGRLDPDDVWSAIHFSMTKALEKFDETKGSFMNLFHTILRHEIKRLRKSCYANILRKTVPIDDAMTDDDAPFEAHDRTEESVEEIVIRRIQKNVEQRRLLDVLEIPEIISRLIDTGEESVFSSLSSLGRALGFRHPHQQAGRLLERVRRTYDYERYGDPADYFIP